METMIWVAVIVIAAILEGMSAQLISIWFVGGGIAGMIAQLCGAPVWLQVLIAAVVTLVLLLATRPLVKKFLQNKETHTNADRVVGQTAVVTEDIDNLAAHGRVEVLGNDWAARSTENVRIQKGTKVQVVRIEGVKLIVTPGIIILIALVIALLAANIKVVPQAHAFVIERLGAYHATWSTGLHLKIPFIDRIAKKVSLKEQVIDFPPQPVITKDNVTMQIDTVVYFQITDSKLYAYGVERPISAIENLSATTLRNIIGEMELDHTLTSRDVINSKIRVILDEATDAWGIKVNRVELKNIIPPKEIQDSMEKQMKAERERRAKILDAEGEKRSAILIAEGQKESAVLRAEAVRETKIREAQGEAEAILSVQRALADSIKLLNEADPNKAVLTLKSFEALEKVADGKATKIIIPSEIQGMAGLAASAKEIFATETPKE